MHGTCTAVALAVLIVLAPAARAQLAPDADHRLTGTQEMRKDLPVLSLDRLSGFAYTPGEPIPKAIHALEGRDVWLRGYMMPTEMTGTTVKAFMLVGGMPGCCFGAAPALNQLVFVSVPDDLSVDYSPDDPVWVRGRLSVGEKLRHGEVESLYRFAAREVDDSEPAN